MTAPKPKAKKASSGSNPGAVVHGGPGMPQQQEKSAAAKGNRLKIHPDRAQEALTLLADFVAERVEVAKDKARLGNTVGAIRIMHNLKQLAEAVAERVKSPLEEAYNSLRFNAVPSFMEDEGITKIGVDGVGRVNVIDDLRAEVLDKKALNDWLIENDYEDMITSTVNAQTLTAFLRNKIKEGKTQNGKDLPKPDIVKITPFVRAQITKG